MHSEIFMFKRWELVHHLRKLGGIRHYMFQAFLSRTRIFITCMGRIYLYSIFTYTPALPSFLQASIAYQHGIEIILLGYFYYSSLCNVCSH